MRTATEKRPRTRIIRLLIEGLAESLIFAEARSPAFVVANRDGPDDRGQSCSTLNDACLNDLYPEHDVDTVEGTVASRVYRLRPDTFARSTSLKSTPVASGIFLLARAKKATLAISAGPRRA